MKQWTKQVVVKKNSHQFADNLSESMPDEAATKWKDKKKPN